MADRKPPAGRGRGRGVAARPQILDPPSAPVDLEESPLRQLVQPALEQEVAELRVSGETSPVRLSSVGQPSGQWRSRGRGQRGGGRGVAPPQLPRPSAGEERMSPTEQPVVSQAGSPGAGGSGEGSGGVASPMAEQESPVEVSPRVEEGPVAGVVTPPTGQRSPVDVEVEGHAQDNNGSPPTIPPSTVQHESSHGKTSTSHPSKKKDEAEREVIQRPGTKGTPVVLKTNYLRLRKAKDSPGMVEYHVSIQSPDAPLETTKLRRKVLDNLVDKIWPVRSFDGMVLFLPMILENEITVFDGTHPTVPDAKVKVTVTFTKVRSVKDCVIFYNILLHRVMREMQYAELRRQYYDLTKIQMLRQHKLEVWPGIDLTAENQEDGVMLWVDTCSRVLQQDTVWQYFDMVRRDPKKKEKFQNWVIGKIVITRYNENRCFRIDEVDWNNSPLSEFKWRDKYITFVEYLRTQYPKLKDTLEKMDMDQPMLISRLKPRKNSLKQEPMLVALIPELCHLTGLSEDQRSNFKVMTDLATSTRLTPAQRLVNLKEFINKIYASPGALKVLNDWGLTLETNLVEVTARKMDGPDLQFSNRVKLTKAGPDFSKEAGQGVILPIEVKKFILLCTPRDRAVAQRFIDTYYQVCVPLGIRTLQLGEIRELKGFHPHNFQDALNNCDPNELQFIICVMPMARDDVYSAIKRHCVANKPIPSQCMLTKTLSNERRLRSIVLKIALQINCKLSGALWSLKMPIKDSVMFVGIDAAHDPKKKDPSVICLVASLNNECTRYYSCSANSKIHEELGNNLYQMMTGALQKFYEFNGTFPNQIVVFRDGGSLGAMDVINTHESEQIRNAILQLCPDALRKYTFVLVTKRIPQRFILEQNRTYVNPHPGTVVDSVVTRRYLYDYYIVSQQVREGTVNPTHFIVLLNPGATEKDEIRPDLIQRMTYATCFMYYNWSGTVRVPAMCQYAHKMAALLSRHVKAPPHAKLCTSLYYL